MGTMSMANVGFLLFIYKIIKQKAWCNSIYLPLSIFRFKSVTLLIYHQITAFFEAKNAYFEDSKTSINYLVPIF